MFPLLGTDEAKTHRLKRQKTFFSKKFLTPVLAFVVGIFAFSGELNAHSVAQVQTTKYFAPETVELIIARAAAGQPGLVVGDEISYIVQFTPVANGSNIGVQGYATDYIPPGTEVIGTWIVNKDGLGNFYEVAPSLPAPSYDGWGARGQSTFAVPFATAAYDATGMCAAGLFTNNCNAIICEVNADTGIFYSTDPRTAAFPAAPTRVVQTLNGYNINPQRAGQLNPIIGQAAATTHNLWDADQTSAFGTSVLPAVAPMSVAPIVRLTRSNTPFNTGSPVAGPQTGYQLDNTGTLGPWQRIYYPGSRMGDQSRGPAIALGGAGTSADPGAVCGFSTSAGRVVSSSNPLPSGTNAVRWALGKLQVGEIKYVKVRLRLTAPVPVDGVVNSSEVFGSDTANGDPSTAITVGDNTWQYHVPSVADNNSSLFVLKKVVAYYSGATLIPSDGTYIPAGSTVRYRTTYVNSGTVAQANVTLSDMLPCQTGANAAVNFVNLGGPITVAPGFAPVTAAGICPSTRATFAFPTLTSLAAGASGSIEYDVYTTAILGDIVVNTATLASTGLPAGVVSNAVSNVNGAPNLYITKSTSTPVVAAGGTATYTLTVGNNGTMPATDIAVYDLLPTSSDIYSATTRFSYAATSSTLGMTAVVPKVGIAATNLTGTVSATNGSLNVTGAGTLFLTELLVNDYIYINNIRYRVATITSNTALTLSVAHVGNVAGVFATKIPNNYNTALKAPNQEAVIWNFGIQSLPVGATFSVTFTANVGIAVTSSAVPYTNDAVVVYDMGLGRADITSTAGVTVTSPFAVSKSIDCFFSGGACVPYSGSLPANAKVRYRIDYANNGISAINNTVLTDTLPCQASLAPVSYNGTANTVSILSGPITSPSGATLAAIAAGVCPATRQSFSFPAVTLNAGQSGTIKYDVQTSAVDGNIVTNDVQISGTAVSTATAQVQTSVVSQPSLSINKSASATAVTAGNMLSYTLTVTNTGTGDATGIVIYDWLPSDGAVNDPLTRFSYGGTSTITGLTTVTPTVTTPPTFAPYNADPYATNMQELAWNFAAQTLAPGASFSITFSTIAGASMTTGASYTNNARAAWTGGSANSQAVAVQLSAQIADISVTKSNAVTSILAGGTTSYDIVFTNNGPNAANNSLLRDAAVTGLTKTGLSCVASGGAVCPSPLTVAALEGAGLNVATFPSGGSITVTVNVNVTAAPGGNVTNTAIGYLPAGFSDGNWSNNQASDTDTVVALITPDLSTSTKTWTNLSGGSPTSGSLIEYTITLNETAGAVANSVTVEDLIPPNVTGFTVTSIPAGATDNSTAAPSGANSTGYLNVSGITVPANGSVTVKFTVTIAATAGTTIDNMATISVPGGTGGSPNAPTLTVMGPNLSTSSKTWVDLNGGDQMPGDVIRYTITIVESDGVATTASVTDDIPLNVTGFVPASMTIPAGATNSSTPAISGLNTNGYANVMGISIPAFGSATVTFDVTIAGGAAPGTLINNAATVTPASGTGGAPTAATITVAGSTLPGTGNKPLYPDALTGMSRTQPAPNITVFAAVPRGSTIKTWTLAPVLAKAVTIDPALSPTVPVDLWLATNANRTFTNVPVSLLCGATVVSTFTQPSMALTTVPVKWSFPLPLAAISTCAAGSAWGLRITNTQGAGGAARDIQVYPSPSAGNYSNVLLPSQNVINIDTLDVYSAVYPSTTKLTTYTTGDTIYMRAVISDPFGFADISSATVTIKDASGTAVISSQPMGIVGTSAGAISTYELSYLLPVSTSPGTWTVEITANEGTEGTVTDLGITTFETTFGPYGGLSGTVFNDTSGDGIKQGGETVMAGVVVDLYNAIGIFIDSYTTDASGNYQFSNITVGNYEVRMNSVPTGYAITSTIPLSVTVTDSVIAPNNNIGLQQTPQITGKVFADADNSGTFNAGDSWLQGATVKLWTGGVGGSLIATTMTDVNGAYEFRPLIGAAGSVTYTIDVDQAAAPISGAALTTGNEPQTATATPGSTHTLSNIGYHISGSIPGYVYEDLNSSGTFDGTPTDGAISGVTLMLYDASMTLITSVVSQADGSYNFSGVTPGNYFVEARNPYLGYLAFSPAVVSPATYPLLAVTIAGGAATSQDFGFVSTSSIPVAGNKPLYTNGTAAAGVLTRTSAPAGTASILISSAAGGLGTPVTFTLTPASPMPMTIDGTTSTTIPVTLWLSHSNPANTTPRTRDITVSLDTIGATAGPIGTLTQTLTTINGLDVNGESIAYTFPIPIAGDIALAAGTQITMTITNVTARAGRDVLLYPVGRVAPTLPVVVPTEYSSASMTLKTVISVDQVDGYSAAYPATTKPAVGYFQVGDWVYARADISDPFGAYDINSVTIDIVDTNGGILVNNAVMTRVTSPADPYAESNTFEYAYQVPTTTAYGAWTMAVSATEGAEGLVADTSLGTFTVQSPPMPSLMVMKQADLTTAKSGAVIVYTVSTQNTGAGVATNVIATDTMSAYSSLATEPWGTGTPIKFIDGTNASGLSLGAITYSDDGGVTYAYPLNMTLPYDPYVTNFMVQMNGTMNGTMNANQAANPRFNLQYEVQVK